MKPKSENNPRVAAKSGPALFINSVTVTVVRATVKVDLPYPGRSPMLLVLLRDHQFTSIKANSANTVVTISRKYSTSVFAAEVGKTLAEQFGCRCLNKSRAGKKGAK